MNETPQEMAELILADVIAAGPYSSASVYGVMVALAAERESLRAQLAAVDRRLAPAELFDSVYDAMYGGMNAGAEERESVAQLCEVLSPLLRAALAASRLSVEAGDPDA